MQQVRKKVTKSKSTTSRKDYLNMRSFPSSCISMYSTAIERVDDTIALEMTFTHSQLRLKLPSA